MSKENTKLEEEFKALANKITEEIEEQLDIAAKAIKNAEKLSEKHGIPFHASVSPLQQTYTPVSFEKKFGKLDKEFVAEAIDMWIEYDGWEHSAVC